MLKAFRDVWSSRNLVWFLVWRDLKVRYRQTIVGLGWAVLQPLVMVAIFSVFLSRVISVPGQQLPYWLFVFCGLVPWTSFAKALEQSSNSIVNHVNLVTKAAFPRVVLPVAAAGPFIVDFIASSVVAFAAVFVVVGELPLRVLLLPLFGLLALLSALSVGIGLSSINVRYRDVKYATPFLVQVWLFATPVVYPLEGVPRSVRELVLMNPMAGVVEGYRWALLDSWSFPSTPLLISAIVNLTLLAWSLLHFTRSEPLLVDTI